MTVLRAIIARSISFVAGAPRAASVRLLRSGRTVVGRVRWAPARSEGGQALTETALILPLLFVLILVVLDFGLALDRRELMQHGVREGARLGATGATVAQIVAEVEEQSGHVLDGEVSVCYVDGLDSGAEPGNAGDNVRVSADHQYDLLIGSGVMAIPAIDMTPVSEARLETTVTNAVPC